MRSFRFLASLAGLALLVQASALRAELPRGGASVGRLQKDLGYLASDALEGRGIYTAGVHQAADYIRSEFKKYGLKSGTPDGNYFQYFSFGRDTKTDADKTKLMVKGPGGEIAVKVGKDYEPFSYGGSQAFDGEIVFAGYGITTEGGKYDDYKDLDVAGKVVLVIRRNPKQDAPKHPIFGGDSAIRYAALASKVDNAIKHKAAALLLVNDPYTVRDASADVLMPANLIQDRSVKLPFAQITQAVANRLLAGSKAGTLKDVAKKIDETGEPASEALANTRAKGGFEFAKIEAKLQNVIGVIEGSGPHANETVVIGAHYDHLGYGMFGSLATRATRSQIHNGADDNGSGTVTMLEIARRFGSRKTPPSRRLVFMAFCAEEEGLVGSRHYASKDPIFPIKDTVAMLNFDMVGRLRDDRIEIAGNKSAKEFEPMLAEANDRHNLDVKLGPASIRGDSDHASFSNVGVPVLFFFTGMHKEYHTPADKVPTINFLGMKRVADFGEDMVDRILAMPNRPAFIKPPAGMFSFMRANPRKAVLGITADFNGDDKGLKLREVSANSAAEKAGLKPGDTIIEFAGRKIANIGDLNTEMQKFKPDDVVKLTYVRGKDTKTVEAKLRKPEQ